MCLPVYIPHLQYSWTSWWTFGLFLFPGCDESSSEHVGAVCLWRTSSPLGAQLDCMTKLLLAPQATATLISKAAVPVGIPTPLPAFVVIISLNFSYSDWSKMTLKVVFLWVSLMPKDDTGVSIELKRLGRDLDQNGRIQGKGESTREVWWGIMEYKGLNGDRLEEGVWGEITNHKNLWKHHTGKYYWKASYISYVWSLNEVAL